ncbi:MAG: hypothetical protein ACE1Y4_13595 [Lysobacterales bacterium]
MRQRARLGDCGLTLRHPAYGGDGGKSADRQGPLEHQHRPVERLDGRPHIGPDHWNPLRVDAPGQREGGQHDDGGGLSHAR